MTTRFLFVVLAAGSLLGQSGFEHQQTADIGDLVIDTGGVIHHCELGYRSAGTLNAARSNAILFPTWFGGHSADLAGFMGPNGLVDTSRYFVIAVDALGNGISSSPSNTPDFPASGITIADMVRAEHKLVTEKFGLTGLHAVMGISMGGMQTFEWLAAYPGFARLAVPIVGSPKLSSPDLLLWQAELSVIEAAEKAHADLRDAMKAVDAIHQFALVTPEYRRVTTSAADWEKFKAGYESGAHTGMDPLDWASQLRAMMAQDVYKRHYDGSMERASAAVKAHRVLVIVATQDHMVNPQTAIDWAQYAGFQLLELTSHCGHMSTSCESGRITEAVRRFLSIAE